MDNELKPCPFCGSKMIVPTDEDTYLCCMACHASTPKHIWNTRNQWVSVKERLPEDGIEVEIAYFDGVSMGQCFGAYIDDVDGWYEGGFKLEPTFNVTHWKGASALPLPPEEEK